ncbi:23S rRNA (adenine(2503)-C(2))-methyltransferase RlmN, partial [bacterium]|nr:23S rRNA (adenine(2503)-C(2))-methyltransferase RlmN [bacterium]
MTKSMNGKPQNLRGLTLDRLTSLVAELEQPAYRAEQLFGWLWVKGAEDFSEMTDLPQALRVELARRYSVALPRVVDEAHGRDGTAKLLLELSDGERVETVLMPGEDYDAACVSTMTGCDLGCAFCATGTLGKSRNLEAHEIAGQVLLLRR